ncbi:MAG: DUF2630 family protein [Hyphomicrobiales bacterium]
MEDTEVLDVIRRLVDEEQELRARDSDGLDSAERQRMQELQVSLDQCWDYLRQRRAAREYGLGGDQANVRPPGVVEKYEQ